MDAQPLRAKSAFLCFCLAKRSEAMKYLSKHQRGVPSATQIGARLGTMAKIAAERGDMGPYLEQHRLDRERYDRELRAWKAMRFAPRAGAGAL